MPQDLEYRFNLVVFSQEKIVILPLLRDGCGRLDISLGNEKTKLFGGLSFSEPKGKSGEGSFQNHQQGRNYLCFSDKFKTTFHSRGKFSQSESKFVPTVVNNHVSVDFPSSAAWGFEFLL